jgi:cyclic pyranopterin phosphate synthase
MTAGNPFSPLKLFTHMDCLYAWWRGGNIYPITLEVGPATVCNHYCTWCMHGAYFGKHRDDANVAKAYPDSSIMKFPMYRGVIDELIPLGLKSVILSGSGEPFINREISEFIRYPKKNGVDIAIITNGSMIREEDIVPAVSSATWIRVSLDAGTSQTRQRVHRTPENDFDDTLRNMRRMAAAKKSLNSRAHLGSQIAVCHENIHEIFEVARISKDCGIDYTQIKPVILHPQSSPTQLEREFYEEALSRARATREKLEDERFKVYVKEDQFGGVLAPGYEKGAYRRCYANFFPIIEANGLVYYCSQTRGLPQFALGDLKKNSFREIWESENRKRINESIDVMQCQPICRCHPINKALWSIRHPDPGVNFV